MEYFHQPVLLRETLEILVPGRNQNFIDCTVGGGGHAKEILKLTGPQGLLIGFDRDPRAIGAATKNLNKYQKRIHLFLDSYSNAKKVLYEQLPNLQYDGILIDLGISSAQVSIEDERGFSFQSDRVLDMRFGPDAELTAAKILNNWSEEQLVEIFKKYGQEPKARAIAREIILFRARKPFELTSQLVSLINETYRGQPIRAKNGKRIINPATKVFQALRIAVNHELEHLVQALPELLSLLKPGGRLAIISYHSLEDKIVKDFFRQEAKDCLCPKEIPVCRCGHKQQLKILIKKPLTPSEEEVSANPRSRSAKLRAIEKI